ADGVDELRIEERLTPCQAEGPDALGVGVVEEAKGNADVEAIGPLDRHATVRTGQIALVGSGKGEVIGAESPRSRRRSTGSPGACVGIPRHEVHSRRRSALEIIGDGRRLSKKMPGGLVASAKTGYNTTSLFYLFPPDVRVEGGSNREEAETFCGVGRL